jgi:hypothetical protein
MTHDHAQQILGILVGGTGGWNSASDETLAIYAEQISTLEHFDIAAQAVYEIIGTWTDARRPPVAVVYAAYRSEARREAMTTPQLTGGSSQIITAAEGRRAAAFAYAKECAKRLDSDPLIVAGDRTNQPSESVIDSLLGSIGEI